MSSVEYGEITRYVAEATGLSELVAGAIVQLTGQLIAAGIMRAYYDPEWPGDREYEAVEACARLAREAHTYQESDYEPVRDRN